MAEVEEWTLRLIDQSSGAAARMASQLDALDAAQTRAADSAKTLVSEQEKAAGIPAAKGPMRDERGRFLRKGALPGAGPSPAGEAATTGDEAQRAATGLTNAAGAADKFLSKRKALRDMLGGEMASRLAALREVGGPVGVAAGAFSNLTAIVGRLGPYGAAAAIGVKVLTYAVTAATAALAGMAAAAISVTAQRAKLMATFSALSFGAVGGARTLAIVERLGVALPFATSEIAQWAIELQKAGFQGRALESALRAVAAAESLIPGGAAAAQQLLTTLAMGGPAAAQLIATLKRGGPEARSQLADMGLRVQDLALALNMTTQQFGRATLSARQMAEAVERALARKAMGPLADLMLTFPVLLTKVKEGFLSLFDKLGPSVRAFMGAVKGIFDQFGRGGSAIKTLKPIVMGIMVPLFSIMTSITKVAGQMLGPMLGPLASIARSMAPLLAELAKFLQTKEGIDAIKQAFRFAASAAAAIAVVMGVLGAAVGAVIAVVVGTWYVLFVAPIQAAIEAIGALIDAFSGVGDSLSNFGSQAMAAGTSFVQGLIGGITSGAGALVAAVQGLASSALGAFKGVLGIASPSKVMAEMGGHTVDGFAQGVDASAGKAQASMDAMVTPSGGKGGAGGKGGFSFTNCTFGEGMSEATVRDLFSKVLGEMAAEGAPV